MPSALYNIQKFVVIKASVQLVNLTNILSSATKARSKLITAKTFIKRIAVPI